MKEFSFNVAILILYTFTDFTIQLPRIKNPAEKTAG